MLGKIKIGKRVLKTSIAVFLSIGIYIIFLFLDELLNYDKSDWKAPSNMYTPFFAGIAAVYAMHRDRQSSLSQAKIRSLGSIIGGYFGMAVTLAIEFVLINVFDLKESNYILFIFVNYLVVSLGIIPLIWVTVVLKQNTASFITCLTYLSVTISIRNGGMPVFQFATNRVFSTLVGVGISLLVNNFSLLRRKNDKVVFVSSLENNFLDSEFSITPYLKYKLNNMYFNKMPLIFMTTRTLSSLEYTFNDVDVNYPMVVMNGAALYHFDSKTYDDVYTIDNDVRIKIDQVLEDNNIQAFKYSINDNCLHCYHDKLSNDGEMNYYKLRLDRGNDDFVRAKLPNDICASLYVIIQKKEVIDNIIKEIERNIDVSKIDMIDYAYNEGISDYWYLKINSKSSNKENLINKIKKENNFEKVIVCGSGKTDLNVIKNADFSICLSTANEYIKENVSLVIDSNPETVLRIFDKIYRCKNINKYIKKISKKYMREEKCH